MSRWKGDGSDMVSMRLSERASLYLAKIRKITLVDTQAVREKLLRQLEGLFDLACLIAKGKVKRLRDDEGEEVKVTLKMRENGRVSPLTRLRL